MGCQATPEAHCCWRDGAVCPHFDPDPPADAGGPCSLVYELGTFEAMHDDPRYLEVWPRDHGVQCGTWVPTTADGICGHCGWDGSNPAVPIEVRV